MLEEVAALARSATYSRYIYFVVVHTKVKLTLDLERMQLSFLGYVLLRGFRTQEFGWQ